MVIFRHATVCRNLLDEWTVRCSNLFYTTQNTHNRQNSMAPRGYESAFPASERPHTNALDFIRLFSIHPFIHSVFCLTTGPKPPPKQFLHTVRSSASSFKWEYPLLSLRSSSSFLRLLPRLLVTSFSPFIFPSITCFRRQFLRKMWPIQLAFRFLISWREK